MTEFSKAHVMDDFQLCGKSASMEPGLLKISHSQNLPVHRSSIEEGLTYTTCGNMIKGCVGERKQRIPESGH
ncbi:MAG: hypothetical protein GY820_34065 [Gammaproteobacteria bacterium]|nr:hypothetical protein [Gammaproteobacteria bacterium]